MNIRETLVSTAAAAVLLASTALTGLAQQTATSSITIGGGNFSASLSATNFANLPYSLTDQTARNGSITVTVSDLTGNALGWTIVVDITDFVGNSRPSEVIPSENLEITNVRMTVAADGSQPIDPAHMTPVYGETDPELTWTADPGYGQGSYNLNMTADLLVPGRTTTQSYTSTGRLSIVTGP